MRWLSEPLPAAGAKAAFALLLLTEVWSPASATEARLLSGELRARDAEGIMVPQSDSNPVVLRYLAPEGSVVKPGDVLVRIDPGQAASQVQQFEAQLEILRATLAKDVVALEVLATDAELYLRKAEAALAKARLDAQVPAEYRSALDYDGFQGELAKAGEEAALKRVELTNAREAVQRKRADGDIDLKKLESNLAHAKLDVTRAEQRAVRGGRILYGFDPWQGKRYQEGSTAYSGQRVGDVVAAGALEVVAYALEPDRVGLASGQSVRLSIDALPELALEGRIRRISGAPEPRSQWGEGRYFTLEIDFELPKTDKPMLPGMSVRVEAVPPTEESKP